MREFPGQGNTLVRGNLWKNGGARQGDLAMPGASELGAGISKVPKRPVEVQNKRWFDGRTALAYGYPKAVCMIIKGKDLLKLLW